MNDHKFFDDITKTIKIESLINYLRIMVDKM